MLKVTEGREKQQAYADCEIKHLPLLLIATVLFKREVWGHIL